MFFFVFSCIRLVVLVYRLVNKVDKKQMHNRQRSHVTWRIVYISDLIFLTLVACSDWWFD